MAPSARTRITIFQIGSDCQSDEKIETICPNDQFQISCRNLKIAAMPCCRNEIMELIIPSTCTSPDDACRPGQHRGPRATLARARCLRKLRRNTLVRLLAGSRC